MSCCDLINNPSLLPSNYPCSCPSPVNWYTFQNKNLLLDDKFQVKDHNSNIQSIRTAYRLKQELIAKNTKYAKSSMEEVKKNNDFDGMTYFSELTVYTNTINNILNNINKNLGFNLSLNDIINCNPDTTNSNNRITPCCNDCNKNTINFKYILVLIVIILIVIIVRKNKQTNSYNVPIL